MRMALALLDSPEMSISDVLRTEKSSDWRTGQLFLA
jgi:hypothetical protein